MDHRFVIFTVLIVATDAVAATACAQLRNEIILKSSLDSENRTAACPGEAVVYTCTVPNTGVLQWAVESFHTFETDSIILSLQYDPVGTVVEEEGGLIIANITAVAPYMIYLGAITSTLTLLPNQMFHNKTVWCGDGVLDETECPCMQNKYGEVPSVPLTPIYTTTHHNTATFTILLEWTRPESDSGMGITNYTTTLTAPYSLQTYVGIRNMLYLTLLYNQVYILQITAANCKGIGPPANISNVYSVSCGLQDFFLSNASNEVDIGTHEGSQVTLLCADDEKVIVFKCSKNGTWIPDPSQVECSNLMPFRGDTTHCKTPVLPPHSHRNNEKEKGVLGDVVVYQCDSGYEPTQLMVSKCSSSGEWIPNIISLECFKQVDCGAPLAPVGGSVYYTGTGNGSKALIECGEGLKLQRDDVTHVALCTANGSWFPDPSIYRCIKAVDAEGSCLSSKESENAVVYYYFITGGAVLLVSLPLGMLLGCVWYRICHFQKKRVNQQPRNIYEEVEKPVNTAAMDMVNNDAYAIPKIILQQ